ncbi:MAG: bifunctional adenosylcobinamide kinase/adenosylcobinamide-phosphate guanylyltransferase [Candidatus Omnitrophica bacterium]|nr:bifunctional adenosylcobinamide kinase/adenosylcobinamide-phosphate guanylyltransferase [Candidatus Omnitrophota bacterium]
MSKITLILGGVRSGKSRLAIKMAKEKGKKVAFIATCRPLDLDREMKKRIELHKNSRPKNWKTFEEPEDIGLLLKNIDNDFDLIIIDCLTLLVSNLLLKGLKEKDIERRIEKIGRAGTDIIIVSNEVGLGIVPDNKLARDFRDIAGKMNQVMAKRASKVFFMASGIPLEIKGGEE